MPIKKYVSTGSGSERAPENSSMSTPPPSRPPAATSGKKGVPGWIATVLFLLLLLSTGGFVWAYMGYKKVSDKVATISAVEAQRQALKKQVEDIMVRVSKHIVLPMGETPTVADIVDAAALAKQQSFYVGSHNGDKVLIYIKAQKAIIYDPNRDVLVNVGPVVLEPTKNSGKNSAKSSSDYGSPVDNSTSTP